MAFKLPIYEDIDQISCLSAFRQEEIVPIGAPDPRPASPRLPTRSRVLVPPLQPPKGVLASSSRTPRRPSDSEPSGSARSRVQFDLSSSGNMSIPSEKRSVVSRSGSDISSQSASLNSALQGKDRRRHSTVEVLQVSEGIVCRLILAIPRG